ncbi:MAG: CoA ester lyase [Gammaproteobacteria bacterium]
MTTSAYQPRRSLIFVPGNKPELFPKALNSSADIVCVDLEDAVAPQHKNAAREQTLALFREPPTADGIERIVRINCLRTAEGFADVAAICTSPTPPPALMLTKVRSADEVKLLADALAAAGHEHIRLHVIIETNDGLEACYAIAHASERVDSLLFGGVDMAAELRVEPTWENLRYARARVVHAAAGAGLDLIDVPYLDLNDREGLEREAAASRALGFTGKAAIHPKQIAAINREFSPSAEAVARARRIIQAFAEANTGLVVVDGKLIEKPVLRSMHRIVAIAERIGL